MGRMIGSMGQGRRVMAGLLCVAGMGCAAWGEGSTTLPDASTPKKAAVAFRNAMFAGDDATERALGTGTEAQFKTASSMGKFMAAVIRVDGALKAKFPEEGKNSPFPAPDNEKEIDAMVEKIDGDNATLSKKDAPAGVSEHKLKKEGGIWKVDLSFVDDPDVKGMGDVGALAKTMNGIADDIGAGKYKTFTDAVTDVQTKMMAGMKPGG